MDMQFWGEVGNLFGGAVGGSAVVMAALWTRLGDIWVNRVAEREGTKREAAIRELSARYDHELKDFGSRLDANLELRKTVDKARFEHEYQIYRDIWAATGVLQAITGEVCGHATNAESTEAVQRSADADWRQAFTRFCELTVASLPFFAPAIYLHLARIQECCMKARAQSKLPDWTPEMAATDTNRHSQISTHCRELAEAIRERLDHIRVV